jgi:hypothetical protein
MAEFEVMRDEAIAVLATALIATHAAKGADCDVLPHIAA